ncbi:hypothetical protein NMG60_11000403 [Bertholletia excelsa]
MDTGSPVGVLVSEDMSGSNDWHPLYMASALSTCLVEEDVSLNELGKDLTKLLHIQNFQELELESNSCQPSDKADNGNVEKEGECTNSDEANIVNYDECLSRSAKFPFLGKPSSPAISMEGNLEDEGDDQGEDDVTAAELKYQGIEPVMQPCSQSISLPTPMKLVSAMKGSRQKQGIPPRKLTVTWAPDVYDPLPSASTFVRIKKPKKNYESKRNGKYKQKSKPSKAGGSSKDKKQVRRHSGSSSSKCFQYQSTNNGGRVACYEPCRDLETFDVGSGDSYCGSSFLKNSVMKLHFSIAEAN